MAWRATTFRLHSQMLKMIDALQRSELYKYADWEQVYSHLPTFTNLTRLDLQRRIRLEYGDFGVTDSNNEVGARICSKIDAVNRPYLNRVHHRFEGEFFYVPLHFTRILPTI